MAAIPMPAVANKLPITLPTVGKNFCRRTNLAYLTLILSHFSVLMNAPVVAL